MLFHAPVSTETILVVGVLKGNTLLQWVLPKSCRIVARVNLSAGHDFLCYFNYAALLPASCISASLLRLIISITIIKKDQGRNECRAADHSLVYTNLERFNLENSSKIWKHVFSLLKICIYFIMIILVTVRGKCLPRMWVSFIVVEMFCLFLSIVGYLNLVSWLKWNLDAEELKDFNNIVKMHSFLKR